VRAKLLARRGDLAEAERVAREALTRTQPTDDIQLRAETLTALAEVLRAADRPGESEAAFGEAVALYERKGNVVAASAIRALSAEPPVGV
jgi:Flp pilus assembly protein TadD